MMRDKLRRRDRKRRREEGPDEEGQAEEEGQEEEEAAANNPNKDTAGALIQIRERRGERARKE